MCLLENKGRVRMTFDERLSEIFRHASWEDGRELHLPESKWEDVIQAVKEAVCVDKGHEPPVFWLGSDEDGNDLGYLEQAGPCKRCGKGE